MDIKVVRIVWIDAESHNDWMEVKDLEDPSLCTTIGFLIKETEGFYYVAATISVEGEALHTNNRILIPKVWIKEFTEIKDALKKKTPRRIKDSEPPL